MTYRSQGKRFSAVHVGGLLTVHDHPGARNEWQDTRSIRVADKDQAKEEGAQDVCMRYLIEQWHIRYSKGVS